MIPDLFSMSRHLLSASNYRQALTGRFAEWRRSSVCLQLRESKTSVLGAVRLEPVNLTVPFTLSSSTYVNFRNNAHQWESDRP